MKEEPSGRRQFLTAGVLFAGAAGMSALVSVAPKEQPPMIRMLAPDGSVVEVEEKVVSGILSTALRATNADVQQWMNNKEQG